MLKVMLVDDEPYILQGLQVLIDWESGGFEIAKLCSNGKEALKYLKENDVDLVISDIKMPEMSGLELLETVKKEKISDAEFVLLTGYDDFAYTQKAIRNGCLDYILKPVEEEELISVLRKVTNINKESIILRKDREKMEDAYLARVIRHLIRGKFNDEDIDYANKHLQLLGNMRFIYIELVHSEIEDEDSDSDEYDIETNTGGLHWWTFLSAYMEIGGDCLFSQIVSIRDKKARGKKLEKYEKDWLRRNSDLVEFKVKYSDEENELAREWMGGGKDG